MSLVRPPASATLSSPLRALAAAVLAGGVAQAQSLIHDLPGAGPWEQRGRALAAVGDVDGDGKADFAVGSAWDDSWLPEAGAVRIFSGATGAQLGIFVGQASGDWFGYSLANAGDVDGNGTPELIVGAPKAWVNGGARPGKAYVYDVATGTLLLSWQGDADLDHFGFSVAGGIDANQDGRADLLVGAPLDDDGGSASGSIRAFSGTTGSIFTTFHGAAAGDAFGYSVAVVGDTTGDGWPDFAVGAKDAVLIGNSRPGRLSVFDGITGSLAWSAGGSLHGDEMGYCVAGGLDMNLDGRSDIVVGAPGHDANGTTSGRAQVLSGANGAQLAVCHGLDASDVLGSAVAVLGDVDGDGRKDFAVGAHQANSTDVGYVEVRSGANGALIYRLLGEQGGEYFGSSVAAPGDVNGDGVADLAVGALLHDAGASTQAGAVRVFSGSALQPVRYCVGKPNSAGCTPWMAWNGMPRQSGAMPFELYAANVLNQRPGTLIYGMESATTPFQGGVLCVRAPVTRMPVAWSGGSSSGTNCSGILSFDFKARIDAALDPRLQAGRTVYTQVWFRDGAASFGTGLSDAVRFTIAP